MCREGKLRVGNYVGRGACVRDRASSFLRADQSRRNDHVSHRFVGMERDGHLGSLRHWRSLIPFVSVQGAFHGIHRSFEPALSQFGLREFE